MRGEFVRFIKKARRERFKVFSKEEREKYLLLLDELIEKPPRFTRNEILVIYRYINRSIGFYLRLTGLCGQIGKVKYKYDGCMENLIFILEYILYRYYYYIPKELLERLYKKVLNIVRFCPFYKTELIAYEIDTGLVEKIHFCMEYYYPK